MLQRALPIFALAAIAAFAQSQRGSITGTVTDTTGAVIAAAKVVVTAVETNTTSSLNSNENGQYTVPNLSPGKYSVRVDKDGFKGALLTNIQVDAGSEIRADVALEVGSSATTVEISADSVALQTENAKSTTVITDKLIRDLPTVVGGTLRSPFDLAILAPETKNFGDNNFQIG